MDLGCVELRVGIKCEGCGATIPLNGPRRVAHCSKCQEVMPLTGKAGWLTVLNFGNPRCDVFTFALDQPPGKTEKGAYGSIQLASTCAWPKCSCGRSFAAEELANIVGAHGSAIACPMCGVKLGVDAPPASFHADFPAVVALVGAETIPDDARADGPTHPKSSHAVVIACAKCGAALDVDGTVRLVPCAHCEVGNYLPDDLWFTLHPAVKRSIWWAVFDRDQIVPRR